MPEVRGLVCLRSTQTLLGGDIKLGIIKKLHDRLESMHDRLERNPVAKVVTQIFPLASATEAAVGALVASARKERLAAFVQEMLGQGIDKLNVDWKKDEYLYAIVRAVEADVQAARVEKVRYFAALLRNYLAGSPPTSIDEFEEILNLVSDMSVRELEVLVLLREHEQRAGLTPEPHPRPWPDDKWKTLVDDVSSRLGVDPTEVAAIFSRLTRTGLCVPVTGAYLDYEGGHYRSTRSLDRFLETLRTGPDPDAQS